MAKLTLIDLDNLNNAASVITSITANNTAIETAIENTLSRDGTTPNEMEADLDMNSNRILNLPDPIDGTEPLRLMDLEELSNGTFYLGDILNVDLIDPVTDGQFLRYDESTAKWINDDATALGAAPSTADYLVKTASGDLSAERVVTDTGSITVDWATAGQAKFQRAALIGDVTAAINSNTTTIADAAVTFAKMQDIATNSLLGRDTAGSGDVENILLDDSLEMSGSGTLQRAALTGDVTASAGSNATTIATGAVALSKMADIATDRIIGRDTAGTGVPEALTGAQVGGMLTLNDLSVVTIASATSGDVVQYSGSAWVNTPVGSFGAPSSADYLVKTTNAGLSAERTVADSATVTWDWSTPGTVTANTAGSGGAPDTADYLVKTANGSLSAERVVTDTSSITWDWATSGQSKANVASLTGQTIPVTFIIAASDETTALTAAADKVKFRMPHAMTVTAVRGSLTTAQTSGSIFTVDIHESGTTILSTKITIDNSEKTSTTAATAAVISDSALADDAEISIDIDQIGDGTAKGLKVTIIGTRTI